ncbi:MAG: hypothetical protein ACOH2F_14055 [Cellulomonas sp.]
MLTIAVPLPDLPADPAPYVMSASSTLGAVACGLGMVAFVVMVLAVMRSERLVTRRSTWILIGTFLATGVGGLGWGYFTDRANHAAVDRASQVQAEVRQGAKKDLVEQLSSAYAVTFTELAWQSVPVADGLTGTVALTFADGRVENCFLGALEGFVEVRCGADSFEDATPIEPIR